MMKRVLLSRGKNIFLNYRSYVGMFSPSMAHVRFVGSWASFPEEYIDEDSDKDDLKRICEMVFPGLQETSFDILRGGLTNKMYYGKLILEDGEEKEIVLRTNGDGSDLIVNRSREMEIFEKLSDFGGTKLYGSFGNGILMEFISGRPLTHIEMRTIDHQKGIAEEMARLHKLDLGLSDDSNCVNTFLDKWMSEIRKKGNDYFELVDLDIITDEIEFLKETTKEYNNRVVFSHNDLLGGNIMYNVENNSYRFIDYEYAGMNYRGFDIGDHFAEYMGFECDGFRPSKELILNFLEHYLNEFHGGEYGKDEMEELYIESMLGTLQSNLLWGVWALFCSTLKDEDFDYLNYGEKKIDVYFTEKKIFCEGLEKFWV